VLALLWAGEIPKWDVSKVRPAGARLKRFGGRASGPAPLVELFNFAVNNI
jgi:ribonucleoside-triphosphate reductase